MDRDLDDFLSRVDQVSAEVDALLHGNTSTALASATLTEKVASIDNSTTSYEGSGINSVVDEHETAKAWWKKTADYVHFMCRPSATTTDSSHSAAPSRKRTPAIDYSHWDRWLLRPDDPASKEEYEARMREEDDRAAAEFEVNNPGFVAAWMADADSRKKAEAARARETDLRSDLGKKELTKGHYNTSRKHFASALELQPLNATVLSNCSALALRQAKEAGADVSLNPFKVQTPTGEHISSGTLSAAQQTEVAALLAEALDFCGRVALVSRSLQQSADLERKAVWRRAQALYAVHHLDPPHQMQVLDTLRCRVPPIQQSKSGEGEGADEALLQALAAADLTEFLLTRDGSQVSVNWLAAAHDTLAAHTKKTHESKSNGDNEFAVHEELLTMYAKAASDGRFTQTCAEISDLIALARKGEVSACATLRRNHMDKPWKFAFLHFQDLVTAVEECIKETNVEKTNSSDVASCWECADAFVADCDTTTYPQLSTSIRLRVSKSALLQLSLLQSSTFSSAEATGALKCAVIVAASTFLSHGALIDPLAVELSTAKMSDGVAAIVQMLRALRVALASGTAAPARAQATVQALTCAIANLLKLSPQRQWLQDAVTADKTELDGLLAVLRSTLTLLSSSIAVEGEISDLEATLASALAACANAMVGSQAVVAVLAESSISTFLCEFLLQHPKGSVIVDRAWIILARLASHKGVIDELADRPQALATLLTRQSYTKDVVVVDSCVKILAGIVKLHPTRSIPFVATKPFLAALGNVGKAILHDGRGSSRLICLANICALTLTIADHEATHPSVQASGLIEVIVEALKLCSDARSDDAVGTTVRKNAAISLAKLAKSDVCGARVRELRGTEILLAIGNTIT